MRLIPRKEKLKKKQELQEKKPLRKNKRTEKNLIDLSEDGTWRTRS